MTQLDGFENFENPFYVCKLSKVLYGLKQAPRAWFDKSRTALVSRGFLNTASDASLFVLKNERVKMLLLIYIDDILIKGSNEGYIVELIKDLNSQFLLKNLGELSYFLGLEACR